MIERQVHHRPDQVERSSDRLARQVAQQKGLAALSRAALRGLDLAPWTQQAVAVVADTLDVELVALLELEGEGRGVRRLASVGWPVSRPGEAASREVDAQFQYVVHSDRCVVVRDLRHETRFEPAPSLIEQGAVSGLSVAAGSGGRTFGIIEAFTRQARAFAADEVQFLHAVSQILTDTLRQRHQSARLERQAAIYRAVEESVPFGIWVADAEGQLVQVSEAFAACAGRSREACLGHGWLDCIAEAERADRQRRWLNAVAERRAWRCEYTLVCGDGGERSVVSRGAPVHDANGDRVGWAGVHVDATERRRAEQQVRQLNARLEHRVAEQTGRLWLMQDIAAAANEAAGLQQVLCYALQRIGEHLGCAVAASYLWQEREARLTAAQVKVMRESQPLEQVAAHTLRCRFARDEGVAGRVLASAGPLWVTGLDRPGTGPGDDPRKLAQAGLTTAIALGVEAGGEVVAAMEFLLTERREPDRRLLEMLEYVSTQLGHVAERTRWQRELGEATWRQQQRFGQDLHDGLGQDLTGLSYLARSLQQRLSARGLPEAETGESVAEGIQNILGQVRNLARGMFPVEVDGGGLMTALEDMAEQTRRRCDLRCRFVCRRPVSIDDNHVATQLFRIAQEATNNAVKHARAREVQIVLSQTPSQVTLKVSDDGVGIEDSASREGIGLRVMRHRAELIRASLEVRPRGDGGTMVTCSLQKDDEYDRQ